MNLGEPIGKGWTSDIYQFGEGQILKLYHKSIPEEFIVYEFNASKYAFELGLPVPQVICEIERVNNRLGFCMEYVKGSTMRDLIRNDPYNTPHYYKLAAELHARIHTCSGAGLHSYKVRLINKVKKTKVLPRKHRKECYSALENLPDGDRLCHGDFSTGNIMVTDEGKLFIIDWSHAGCGEPISDFTRTHIISQLFQLIDSTYLEAYLSFSNHTMDDIDQWIKPTAISLIYDIPQYRKQLMAIATDGLDALRKF